MPTLPVAVSLLTAKTARNGSAAGAETTLLNFLLPPGLFRAVGDMLIIRGVCVGAANVNNKTVVGYFAGTACAQRGPATDNASTYMMEILVTYLGGNTFQSTGSIINLVTATVVVVNQDSITQDPQLPIEIKMTGNGVALNDVVSRLLKYSYVPVNSSFGL